MRNILFHITLLVSCLFHSFDAMTQGANPAVIKRGAQGYEQHCSSCHQRDGSGVARLIPPLVGTDYVNGNKSRLIRILLEGLNERIIVQDEEYYSPMASFQHLSDQQIADILTFIRARFGSGASPVSAKEVQGERKRLKK